MFDVGEPTENDGIAGWPGWHGREPALQRAGIAFEVVVAYRTSPGRRICTGCGSTDRQPDGVVIAGLCQCKAR